VSDSSYSGHEIEIRPLRQLDTIRFHQIGTGYSSPAVYRVGKAEHDLHTTITMTLEELKTPYNKQWEGLSTVA
jgi:hypothetical protein